MRRRIMFTLPVTALLKKEPSIGRPLAVLVVTTSLLTAVPYIHRGAFFDPARRYPGIGNWTPQE
jgi:hypothetical protein